jgi:hypothetical protein
MLVDELRREFESGQVLAIVGTGVSIGATQNQQAASWKGLLNSGIDPCTQISDCPPGWADRIRAQIGGDMIDLLCAAENISQRLNAPEGGEFARWLSETIGTLEARDLSVLNALSALEIPIATTNYDHLIEDATGLRPVTWRDRRRAVSVVRGRSEGVLHLHGSWEEPESVVLGIRSYDDLARNEFAQSMLRALRTMKTMIFVGFGSGLKDPTFAGLLKWAGRIFAESETRHYRLCLTSDLADVRRDHPAEQRIVVVDFGQAFADLPGFLAALRSNGSV